MDSVFTYFLYGMSVVLLVLSFVKDKSKTFLSLKRAWKMFVNLLPQFIAILMLAGILLAVVSQETIQYIIGAESGFMGMLITSFFGAIILIPALIAFPVAAELLRNGAGITQIAVFVSTLTTVGFVTLPIEIKYLGKKVAIIRNILSFLFSFVAAYIIGAILT